MSFQNVRRKHRESDATPEPSAARRAKPRLSLKMQAIGFLSRREHSRQELRAKLLESLRKRAREDAMLAAASDKAARELAEALQAHPSNGIDDAFTSAPPKVPAPTAAPEPARATRATVARARHRADAGSVEPAFGRVLDRAALDTLGFADGAPLSTPLRARLAAAAGSRNRADAASATRTAVASPGAWMSGVPAAAHAGVDSDPLDAAEPASESAAAGVISSAAPFTSPADDGFELTDPEAAVDDLLDWLVANNYLSESRFVESRVNARSRKQGTLRIKLELSRHGLVLEPDQAAALRETEYARAQALWQRKFGAVAPDARLRAKQARFLAARGFAADIVRRVVGGEEEF